MISKTEFLRAWLGIGLQSFGGGAATLYLIRRTAVERHGWLSDSDFTRDWGICQIAPGINLFGMAILIGWRALGAAGVALALLGMLLPSVAITIGLTAAYATIKSQPLVQAALHGVVPATVGLGLLLGYSLLRPLLAASRKEGRASLLAAVALFAGSALAVSLAHISVLAALWGCGGLFALFSWWRARWPR
ncbi:MAG TPA: chromate transporter [Kouleothrix sp.]|jgi:chromate transporter|uniref:chromate transporter n=1 Tax=Kouleothrix sp. TaxID=2779161 RepID=UPI002C8DBAB6|nr:chromate transporter [Kouleothrix sp.]HRC75985.1 chromate transporter [Kouleothrix sp.]